MWCITVVEFILSFYLYSTFHSFTVAQRALKQKRQEITIILNDNLELNEKHDKKPKIKYV